VICEAGRFANANFPVSLIRVFRDRVLVSRNFRPRQRRPNRDKEGRVPKVLVTGGAGFIGSHLVEQLVRDGAEVRVLDDLSTGNLDNLASVLDRIEFHPGEIQDPDLAKKVMEGVEVVYHQAALASVPRSVARPLDTHLACATGTVVLLDAARQAGVRRFVYAASSSAYGNCETLPKHEGLIPEPCSPYAAAKLAGELYCEAFAETYGLETVRLRYFNVFGPRQDPNSPYSAVIPLFVAALLAGKQPMIFGDGKQSRDFTYVDNVVSANILAGRAAGVSGKVYNVGCGGTLVLIELLEEICRQLGKPCQPNYQPPRTGDVKHSWADISRTQADLGYRVLVDWKEGLRRAISFYVAQAQGG